MLLEQAFAQREVESFHLLLLEECSLLEAQQTAVASSGQLCPDAERFRTIFKGHGSGILTPVAENQVALSLMKSDFLKGQSTVELCLYPGHSSGVCTLLLPNAGHQLDGHSVTSRNPSQGL